ncbi:hypothetical protein GZ77_01990 [Endozoicomonas montiporae]|uniref:N-acetyltransferase domain-containing protein n=2 Tax=Endozoicomonas montiporae TaxID=1027273 RepID=A0A081NAG8_9GAMM|nr:GNAT family N-acetyltransferase [Endozoicomonas montiporae]AMO56879.1 hypothetical protein EZMO1_2833 [Endozoicomonas montiporae CL-33]KEQ15441.1 hypothetical protein GZ77_01990 [Endozoicomonas montiporae]
MKILEVTRDNHHIYANLYQGYSAEFSKIVQEKPDKNGLYEIEPKIEGHVSGYLLFIDDTPAALTAIANKPDKRFEVCDFYVLPYFRKNKVGKRFISELFKKLGGSWEIKQVAGADHAVSFWRDVINDYTSGNYLEDIYQDERWGTVTRQRFTHPNNP